MGKCLYICRCNLTFNTKPQETESLNEHSCTVTQLSLLLISGNTCH